MLLLACAVPPEYEAAACDASLAGSLREGASWTYDHGSVITLDTVSRTTLDYRGPEQARTLACGEAGLYLEKDSVKFGTAWDVSRFDPPVLLVPAHPHWGDTWEVSSVMASHYGLGTTTEDVLVTGEVTGTDERHTVEGEPLECAVVRLHTGTWSMETCFTAGVGVVVEESAGVLVSYAP